MSTLPALIERSQFPALFAPRATDSNKGSFGSLGVLDDGPDMTGATLLAARAALKLDAGQGPGGPGPDAQPADLRPPAARAYGTAHDLLTDGLPLTAWTAERHRTLPRGRTVPAAVWLYGAATDALVARGVGPIGLPENWPTPTWPSAMVTCQVHDSRDFLVIWADLQQA